MHNTLASIHLDVHRIEAAIDGRLGGTKILHYETLSSTMDEAARLAEEGSPEERKDKVDWTGH